MDSILYNFDTHPDIMNAIKTPGKKISILIHIAVWVMIFVSPLFFMPSDADSNWLRFYTSFSMFQFFVMIVFYLNYFYLVNHFLFRKQTRNFLLCNLGIIIAFLLLYYLLDDIFIKRPIDDRPEVRFGWALRMSRDIIMYSLTAALSVAIKMTIRWYKTESERSELEKNRAEAELKNLKSQLNPHFLFNTLNNIYSLIAINQEDAQEAVHQLSKLLRYVLYDNNQAEVSVRLEIDFMRNYLKLIRLRFPSRVDIRFDVKGENSELQIAPLMFITLIENAFKHGISNTGASFVHISLDMTNPAILLFTVDNSYYPKDDTDRSGSGIGLENLKKRLELLYHKRYVFVNERIGDTYHVSLKIEY